MKMINRYYIGQHVYIGANFCCPAVITAIEEDPEVIPALCYTFKGSAGGYEYKDKVLEHHIFEKEQDFEELCKKDHEEFIYNQNRLNNDQE